MLIRSATPADAASFVALVEALATYEHLPPPDEAAKQRLLADAFGDPPRFELWLAELDGRVVAYAATFVTYSTFLAKPTLFLEDLFVHPDARRRGIGRALMGHLETIARERGCGRFEWTVLDWNQGAQTFYEQLGAEILDGWRVVRKVL